MIEKTLEKLGLRDDEAKAFLFLLEHGEQTAGNLAKKTGLSRPSLYGFLKKLQHEGLVIESQENGVKTFSVAPKDKIKLVIDQHIDELTETKSSIEKVFAELQNGNSPHTEPRLQFFEGKEELQFILRDMLLYRDIETKAYWPIKSMIETLGEEFFIKFNKDRIARNISVRAIWPQEEQVDIQTHPYLGIGEKHLREIRITPKEVAFQTGYWIYGDKVAFISSQKENFGFILSGKEFANMLVSQFEVIWNLSKAIEPEN